MKVKFSHFSEKTSQRKFVNTKELITQAQDKQIMQRNSYVLT